MQIPQGCWIKVAALTAVTCQEVSNYTAEDAVQVECSAVLRRTRVVKLTQLSCSAMQNKCKGDRTCRRNSFCSERMSAMQGARPFSRSHCSVSVATSVRLPHERGIAWMLAFTAKNCEGDVVVRKQRSPAGSRQQGMFESMPGVPASSQHRTAQQKACLHGHSCRWAA